MKPHEIQATTPIESLVEAFPEAVSYLAQEQGIQVICCGEPVWATLEEVARSRKADAAAVLAGLRAHLAAGAGKAAP